MWDKSRCLICLTSCPDDPQKGGATPHSSERGGAQLAADLRYKVFHHTYLSESAASLYSTVSIRDPQTHTHRHTNTVTHTLSQTHCHKHTHTVTHTSRSGVSVSLTCRHLY